MSNEVYLLSGVLGLAFAWFIWSLGIKKFFLDLFRERIFEQRFKLFRLGMSGELPFDDDTYRTLETLLCGLLRYSHRTTVLTYILSLSEQERAKKAKDYVDVSRQIALKISRLEPRTQEKLTEILSSVRSSIHLFIAFRSLSFLAFLITFVLAKRMNIVRIEDSEPGFVLEREAYRTESQRSLSPVTA